MKKATEYYEDLRLLYIDCINATKSSNQDDLKVASDKLEDGIKTTMKSIMFEFRETINTRNIRKNEAVVALIKELNQKWNKIGRLFEKEFGEGKAPIRMNGINRFFIEEMPELRRYKLDVSDPDEEKRSESSNVQKASYYYTVLKADQVKIIDAKKRMDEKALQKAKDELNQHIKNTIRSIIDEVSELVKNKGVERHKALIPVYEGQNQKWNDIVWLFEKEFGPGMSPIKKNEINRVLINRYPYLSQYGWDLSE